jgi:hypothetical protein
VQLATIPLGEACGPACREYVDELSTSATAAHASLTELMAVARPPLVIERGAPVGPTVVDMLATLRLVAEIDVHVTVATETATRCTSDELEHLLIGLVLDVADESALELHVRERVIEAAPWIEILRITKQPAHGDGFDLRAVTAIAARAGGEVTTSSARDGGLELVVALPVVS